MRFFRQITAGLCALLAPLILVGAAHAGEVSVAVAANFTEPAKEIAAAFQKATDNTAALSFGASGGFYAQISHGAPYQVFLSADDERPKKAEADGLAVPNSRFTYAVGRLVLYSRTPGLIDDKGGILRTDRFAKLAIADPGAAPYGQAAIETLTKLGLYDRLKPKVVQGASIAQTYEFTASGAAELGFVAQSQVIKVQGGSRWLVPEALHAPIVQDAVLLKTGADNAAAKAFMSFLKSPAARDIIRRYGYESR